MDSKITIFTGAGASFGCGEADAVGRLADRRNDRRFGGGSSVTGDGDRLTAWVSWRLALWPFAILQTGQERPSHFALLTRTALVMLAMRSVS